MRLLGKIKCCSSAGRVIVRGSFVPDQDRVYDARGREFGRVVDVFGNIREPYVVIESVRPAMGTVGFDLYLKDVRLNEDRKGSERRNRRS